MALSTNEVLPVITIYKNGRAGVNHGIMRLALYNRCKVFPQHINLTLNNSSKSQMPIGLDCLCNIVMLIINVPHIEEKTIPFL